MKIFICVLAGYSAVGAGFAHRLRRRCKRLHSWDDRSRKAARRCVLMWPVALAAEISVRRDFRCRQAVLDELRAD